jgi:capsule polysaccharide export protein KpsC/LpsZ
MNELADNLILARNVLVYSMAFYAGWTLLKKYLI